MTATPDLSDDTRATLLLCGRFGTQFSPGKPLTQSEFYKLDSLLQASGLTPANLLEMTNNAITALYNGQGDMPSRLSALQARTNELDDACAVWSKLGIWVLGQRDKGYPSRLRQRLNSACPPLLFGAGRVEFIEQGGVCIVGSRDSSKPALEFSATLAARCANENLTVISSDMRGVDRQAVSSTLSNSGRVVVVLSDRLEKVVIAKRYRQALSEGLLTMVTPFSPNAGFSVANAIRVNRYQYALSDVAVVVETRRKGGIWSGADENRNEGWVPAFVRSHQLMSAGNSALLHLGLIPLTLQDIEDIDNLGDFFTSHAISHNGLKPGGSPTASKNCMPLNLYSIFLSELQKILASAPLSESDIVKHFSIAPNQALIWLQQAENEGKIRKAEEKSGEPVWTSSLGSEP